MLLELGDADIAVARFDQLRFDALDLDDGARQGDDQRLGFALADHGERDLGAGLAAHALDRIVQRQALDRGVVQLDDQVAAFNAGLEGRRILDRRDHLDEAVFHADLDAEAAEFALRADLQFLEGIGVEIGGMRIEAGEHAVDGFGDELLVVHRLDIVALDLAEDLGEGAQVIDRQRTGGFLVGHCGEIEADHHADDGAKKDQACFLHFAAHYIHPRFTRIAQ